MMEYICLSDAMDEEYAIKPESELWMERHFLRKMHI